MAGLLSSGIENIFLGPGPFLVDIISEHLSTVIITLGLLGCSYAMICVPIIPEIMAHMDIIYPQF